MLHQGDDKSAHGLGGHDVGPTVGMSVAGKIHGNVRMFLSKCWHEPVKGIDTLRPGSREQNQYPILGPSLCIADLEATDLRRRNRSDIWKLYVAHIHTWAGNDTPNIGNPLFDCARVASSCITSQCSTRTPSAMRRMSAAIQFTGRPKPLKRPCTMTKSPSAKIGPCSYFPVGGKPLPRLKSPSRPGTMWELC